MPQFRLPTDVHTFGLLRPDFGRRMMWPFLDDHLRGRWPKRAAGLSKERHPFFLFLLTQRTRLARPKGKLFLMPQ